jgi:hypothetical protein
MSTRRARFTASLFTLLAATALVACGGSVSVPEEPGDGAVVLEDGAVVPGDGSVPGEDARSPATTAA